MSAARGGAFLFAASAISLGANYIFLLGAGRLLGSHEYGTVAALLGVLTVVLLPGSAIQMAVSREISAREAVGEHAEASRFVSAVLAVGLKAVLPLAAAALLFAYPLRALLGIAAVGPVLLALASVVVAVVTPVAFGVLQGSQRFPQLAYVSALPMLMRLGLLIVLAVIGMRLYGALVAVTASTLAGAAVAVWLVREHVRPRLRAPVLSLRPFFAYLWPVAIGLLGISLLTNVDILIAKARFSPGEAGAYAAASAFARVAFFLPATILSVLFPRTAARHARGEGAGDILGRSLIVTAAFCGFLTAGYALVGDQLVRLTFGADFASAPGLLVPFSIAMAFFSLANVLVGYHLSRGQTRFVWLIAAAVAVQIVLLSTVASSLRGLVWIDLAVAIGLVVAHEIGMGSSVPALAAGLARFHAGAWIRRALAVVAGKRAACVEGCIVIVAYAALTVAITWPLALHLGSWQFGVYPDDGTGTVGWLWQLHHEGGYRLLGTTHHTLTGAPLGWDQGNALNFQWLLPYYPAYLLSGVMSGLAALNLVMLAGFVLSGAAMYLLVRWLGCPWPVAAWAGLVYVVFPWHLQRALLGVGSLVHLEIFPLLLLAIIAWVRRPSDSRALLVALAVVGAWLTSGYFGTIALLGLAGASVAGFLALRRANGSAVAARRVAVLLAASLVGSGVFAVIAVAAGGSTGIALGRSAGDIAYWGAHLRDYLPAPINSPSGDLATHLDSTLSSVDYPGAEGPMYPGVLTVLLALAWVVPLVRRKVENDWLRVASWSLVGVVIVGVVFAAPNPMRIGGIHIHPMPSLLVFKLVPAFRVPTRLAPLLLAALVPLAALGLARVCGSVRRRLTAARAARLATGVLCVCAAGISVAELGFLPMPFSRIGATPTVYAALQRTPNGILAEYPLETNMSPHAENSIYVYWQRAHGRPLLNGAARGTPADGIRRMLVDPRAPGTAPSLALLGVTAVITRPTTYDWDQVSQIPDAASYGAGYELVESLPGDVRVWRVTAKPAPAVVAYGGPDVDEPLAPLSDGFVGYPVLSNVVHVDLYAKKPGLVRMHLSVRVVGPTRHVDIRGRSGVRDVTVDGRIELAVPVLVPRGQSSVTITIGGDVSPVAATGVRPVMLSSPWLSPAHAGDLQQALKPVLSGVKPGF